MAEYKSKVLIIGSGPAGYTAGIYAARAGLKPVLVSGTQVGGQLTITTEVENFPGFPEPIQGGELMQRMRDQAQNVGVQMIDDTITEIDFEHRPFVCSSENANSFVGDSLIIATGASARWLGLPSEEKFRGFGVSACATCDGFFYRNRNVAVVGGGNSALEEALYLTNFAKNVTIIHRRDAFRADKTMQERVAQNHKINVIWNCVVEEILGTESPLGVTGLRLKNVKTDNTTDVAVYGVFIAIGHHPNTDLVKGHLHLDKENYIVTKHNSCETSIKGVFAAGDVRDPQYRQAIIAAGSGCVAALEAEKYLNELGEQKNAVKPEAV